MQLTYVIGEPGVGKTTLLAAATEGLEWYVGYKPFAHVIYDNPGVAELGPRKANAFSGTDGLSMSAHPKVVDWLTMAPFSLILGEGDRLSSGKFFTAVKEKGYNLTVVHLVASPMTMENRRIERAAGANLPLQNSTWLRGRQTKVANLAAEWADVTIDAEMETSDMLYELDEVPVFKQLREARLAGT
jgi:hypothetical protein